MAVLEKPIKKYPLSLPDAYVDNIVKSITAAVPAKHIYIFGSYARGEERPDSDVDIYIVTDGNERRFKYMSDARWALLPLTQSMDVLCNSAEQFAARKNDLSCIEYIISREGVLIYER